MDFWIWYQMLPVDSGASFIWRRQAPDKFAVTYGEETEPVQFVVGIVSMRLIGVGQPCGHGRAAYFRYPARDHGALSEGIEYITLITEVNIARRTSRRMVASLLSAYHCFFQRGGSMGL